MTQHTLAPAPASGEEGVYTPIPGDLILDAELVEVNQVEKPFKDKETDKPVEKMEFAFKILTPGQFADRRIWGETSTEINAGDYCKFKLWLEALLDMPLTEGFKFDTNDLKGLSCQIRTASKDYKDRAGNEKTRSFVAEVLPTGSASVSVLDSESYVEDPF